MFQTIQSFFHDLWRSSYDVEFYREVRSGGAKRSFRYLAGLVLLFVLLGATQLAPAAMRGRDAAAGAIKRVLPDGTVVGMKAHRLETNLPAPFDLGLRGPQALIDSSIEGTETRDVPEGTLVFGRDAVFFRGDNTEVQIEPYRDIPDFSLTKEQTLSAVEGVSNGTIAAFVALLSIPWFLVFLAGTTLSVALNSLLVHFVAKFAKAGLRYSQWFAVGCHAVTLPLVATTLFGDWLNGIPFSRTLLFLMVVAAVIADERARPVGIPEHEAAKS